MVSINPIAVRVSDIKTLTPRIKQIHLSALDDAPLPAFEAGSHIIVSNVGKSPVLHNAYSLINYCADPKEYVIAVQFAEPSRGGSRYLHQQLQRGDELHITPPKNVFALLPSTEPVVLIAGGIGITPILAFAQQLTSEKRAFELHYSFRGESEAAFKSELQQLCGNKLHLYDSQSGNKLSLNRVVNQANRSAHFYVCGPNRMIDALQSELTNAGIASAQFHTERFSASETKRASFNVVLAKSGQCVAVNEQQTILQALQQAGRRDLPSLCCEGVCGSCEVTLLQGEVDHRDQYFTDAEKAAQKSLLICVSRARSDTLVLDI